MWPKGYRAFSPTVDGGIIAPTAALSSFAFRQMKREEALRSSRPIKWKAAWDDMVSSRSFSPATGWTAKTHLATNQGLIVAMMENHRSGLALAVVHANAPEVQRGLDRLVRATEMKPNKAGPRFDENVRSGGTRFHQSQ